MIQFSTTNKIVSKLTGRNSLPKEVAEGLERHGRKTVASETEDSRIKGLLNSERRAMEN